MEEFFPAVLEKGHGEIEVRFRHFKTGEARWMAYKVVDLDRRRRAAGRAGHGQPGRHRDAGIMEDDLRSLAADLSEADRRKDEFLAMLAHELRNPLAPISNAVRSPAAGRQRRRRGSRGSRNAGAAGRPDVAAGGRPAGREPHHAGQDRAAQGARAELAPILNQAVEAAQALFEKQEPRADGDAAARADLSAGRPGAAGAGGGQPAEQRLPSSPTTAAASGCPSSATGSTR